MKADVVIKAFLLGVNLMYFFMVMVHSYNRKKNPLRNNLTDVLLIWFVDALVCAAVFVSSFRTDVLKGCDFLADLALLPTYGMIMWTLIKNRRIERKMILSIMFPYVGLIIVNMFLDVVGKEMLVRIMTGVSAVIGVGMYGHFFGSLYIYEKKLKQYYSDLENRHLKWLLIVMTVCIVFNAVWSVSSYMSSDLIIRCISVAFMLVMWQIIFRSIDSQRTDYLINISEETEEEKEAVIELQNQPEKDTEDAIARIEANMQKLFETEKVYLQKEINAVTLASMLGTNRTYLSWYFSKRLNVTFYDYVNSYRLDYAREMLVNGNDTIEDIAQMSGFSSVSTFRRAFAKKFSVTPSEMRKSIQ